MKWMEIIKLRSSGRDELIKALDICRSICKTHRENGPHQFCVFRNNLLDTDICVCIYWENSANPREPSMLATQLMGVFEGFGISNHSMWSPEEFAPTLKI